MNELSTRYDRYTISSTEGVKKRAVWPGFWFYPAIKGSLSGTTSMSKSPAMVVKFLEFVKSLTITLLVKQLLVEMWKIDSLGYDISFWRVGVIMIKIFNIIK